ncbi:hypothetical protein LTS10_000768 [Elasticomyces elasticus]|nr:hypothetical protein LTS10_000768 [Elasticomyces elasticus]
MSSSDSSEEMYENPALEDDDAFRDAVKAAVGVSLADMMEGDETYGQPRYEYKMATTHDIVQVKRSEAAAKRIQQARAWDDMFQSLRTYVVNADDSLQTTRVLDSLRAFDCLRTYVLVPDNGLRTTYILDSLRADLKFMRRVEPYVYEGLYEEEITRDLAGYQAGCTYYTLALQPDWLYRPIELEKLTTLLPVLQVGEASADGLLNNTDDVRAAVQAMGVLANQLRKAYKTLHSEMACWFDGGDANAAVWIDLSRKRCEGIRMLAQKMIDFAEQLYQECEWHRRHGETVYDNGLPRLEIYLRKVTKTAVFTHLDLEREAERKHENGGPY